MNRLHRPPEDYRRRCGWLLSHWGEQARLVLTLADQYSLRLGRLASVPCGLADACELGGMVEVSAVEVLRELGKRK